LAVESWRSTSLTLLGESDEHWPTLAAVLRATKIAGPQVHDARIASLCIEHGIEEVWSADRDFSRFPALRCKNPLVDG
jgi:predicted nucleic acid-binding protein